MSALVMPRSSAALVALGLTARDCHELPSSTQRFADGGSYRVEIPSVEGPAAFEVVMREAHTRDVPVHRVSQGSGVWMLTDGELNQMAEQGQKFDTEVVLFTGPRAAWDIGAQARSASGAGAGGSLRGSDQLAFGIEDALRAADHGISGVLVADLGLLRVLGHMKRRGDLPETFALKVSISLPVGNAATAQVLQDLGATSLNLPVDLSLASIAAIRAAVALPLDVYIEAPDDFGGTVRHYEVADLVRVAAPIYVKYTVRNAPNTYPSGLHLQSTVLALAERVRRAQLGLDLLNRFYPEAKPSPSGTQVADAMAASPATIAGS